MAEVIIPKWYQNSLLMSILEIQWSEVCCICLNRRMPTQQPSPAPNGEAHDPYAFLYDTPGKKRSILPSGNSTKQRIMIVVGGFITLMILFVLLFSLILGHKSGNSASLTSLAQQQTEMSRVAAIITQNSRDNATQAFSSNVQYSMVSDQKSLVKYLAKHGVKLKSVTLNMGKKSSTDTLLANAKLAGTYEVVGTAQLQKQLQQYQNDLAVAFKSGSSAEKAELRPLYIHATTLLKNLPQSAATSS
jgi:hypothetical protein